MISGWLHTLFPIAVYMEYSIDSRYSLIKHMVFYYFRTVSAL